MNFKTEHKPLLIGIAAGFSVAMLCFTLIFLTVEYRNIKQEKQELEKQLFVKKIEEIPLTIIKDKNEYDKHENFVYEEFPKHDEEQEASLKDDSIPAYIKNRQPVTLDPNKVKIAIIIDDLGVNTESSAYSASHLPKEITFSYLPYGKSTQKLIKQEYKKHREALLHLPTEPVSSIDPGPNALYEEMNKEKIEQLTYHNVNQVLDYIVGANNHMGSKFTANLEKMEYMLNVLNKNHLMYIDSFTTSKTKAKQAKNKVAPNMPLITRHIFLDHKRTKEFIFNQLEKAEKVAKRKGYAIAIGHPHRITTDSLLEWIKTLDSKGIQLVPITSILEIEGFNLKPIENAQVEQQVEQEEIKNLESLNEQTSL